MITTLGTIDLQLYDDQAPITVANFLRYAGRGFYGTYNSTFNNQVFPQIGFIYRSVPGFVIQSGSYAYDDISSLGGNAANYFQHPMDPPIQNEFSASRPNITGTIAMAKVTGNPNSATSDWFINLADNSANLDNQNGGYTVFGEVIDTSPTSGMTVVNEIVSLPILDESGQLQNYPILNGSQYLTNTPWCSAASQPCNLPIAALNTIPVNHYDTTVGLDPSNLVEITSIPNVISTPTIQGSGKITGPGDLLMTFTADLDMTFTAGSITTADTTTSKNLLATFTPPPSEAVQFNDGIFQFTVTWAQGSSSRIVTLHNDDPATANHYYAYGPTSDNPAPHWYDFMYDGTTGAEFVGNQILLHFVDGQRGDIDLTANNSITHAGAPAVVTPIPSSNSGGCTIAALPSQPVNNGDWVMISLFLAFVALIRRRTRREPVQRATNIASP
ncbi:MAG: peptidylprolyl isomerase [Sulfuricaulis sp.]